MLQSLCGVDFNKTLAGQLTKSSTHFQASQVVGWRPLEGVFSTISKMGIKQKIAIESKSMPPLCLVLSLCDDDGTALLHIANGMKRNVFNTKCVASSNIEFLYMLVPSSPTQQFQFYLLIVVIFRLMDSTQHCQPKFLMQKHCSILICYKLLIIKFLKATNNSKHLYNIRYNSNTCMRKLYNDKYIQVPTTIL